MFESLTPAMLIWVQTNPNVHIFVTGLLVLVSQSVKY